MEDRLRIAFIGAGTRGTTLALAEQIGGSWIPSS